MTFTHVVTLTYRDLGAFRAEHLLEFVQAFREWADYKRCPPRYVWTREVQRDGRQHFHVAIALPRGCLVPLTEMTRWWPHGHLNVFKHSFPVAYVLRVGHRVRGV